MALFRCFARITGFCVTGALSPVRVGWTAVIAGLFFGYVCGPVLAEEVKGIRSWASPERTRLVFDLSEPVRYSYFALKDPERLVVDIYDTRIATAVPAVDNRRSLLKRIRHGAHKKGSDASLRMVLDLKTPVRPEVFLLEPYKFYGHRLVVDMYHVLPPAITVAAMEKAGQPADGAGFTPSPPLKQGEPAALPKPAAMPPSAGNKTPAVAVSKAPTVAVSEPPAVAQGKASIAAVSEPPAVAGSKAPVAGSKAPVAGSKAPVAGSEPPAVAKSKASIAAVSEPPAVAGSKAPIAGNKAPTVTVSKPLPSARSRAPAAVGGKSSSVALAVPPATKMEIKSVRRDVIVAVDAGHGGDDPGAIGANGTKEKHVALQIAKWLAERIDAEKGMRAFLVREGDYYVNLQNRVKKTRVNKADLFISIHADAFKDPSVRGASVFVLSRKKATSKRARMLADRENASDFIGGVNLADKDDVVALVLVDLSQSAALEASIEAARHIIDQLDAVGKVHKRRVEAAGFLVLTSPDVPSILVESGYMSNPEEEKKLNDPTYQKKLAQALFKGIKSYFSSRPPPDTLFAHLRERQEKDSGLVTQN